MPDADWYYHVTRPDVARFIQQTGMRPAVLRIGAPVAHPNGAFVRDREAKQVTKYKERLKSYVAGIVARGGEHHRILLARGVYVPFVFAPTGNRAADVPALTDIENEQLANYRMFFPALGPRAQNVAQVYRSPATAQSADTLFLDRGHFLTRLAIQATAMEYKIEEVTSASHIYFIQPAYAVDCYRDYKRHLGGGPIVALRVARANVNAPVQDDAEFRAVMSATPVPPNAIEILDQQADVADAHNHFLDNERRQDDHNWIPIAQWNGP